MSSFKKLSAYADVPCEWVSAVAPCNDKIDQLKAENAKLRNDLEDANNQAEEVCIENAKLRELVRIAIEYCVNGYCEEEDECPLYESRHSCRLHAEACELGVDA